MQTLATTLLAIASLTTLGAAAGCLGEDEDGDPSSYVAITELKAASRDAFCTHFTACGLFPDKATCLGANLDDLALGSYGPDIVEAVYAGRIRYNGSNVRACLDAIAARSCDRTDRSWVLPEICGQYLEGTRASGEGCLLDAECISQQCVGNDEESCSMGLCTGDTPPVSTRAPVDEPCGANGCVAEAYCELTSDICRAREPLGSACTSDAECEYGLGCTGALGARTCNVLPAIGQSCATDGVCRDLGAYCDGATQQCTPLGLAGATCSTSAACSRYFPCNFSMGQCDQGAALGESCSASQPCFAAGTYCNPSTSTCTELAQNGLSCDGPEDCQSDFCYFGTGSVGICTMPMTCSGA